MIAGVELGRAVLGLVDLQTELDEPRRVGRVGDVGQPRLGRAGERVEVLRQAAAGGTEDAFLRVQEQAALDGAVVARIVAVRTECPRPLAG